MFLLDPYLLKLLSFENVYKILPVIDTIAELYPSFSMSGPWYIVILEGGLLWTKTHRFCSAASRLVQYGPDGHAEG